MKKEIDISENELLRQSEGLLQKLLLDHTTQKNIFWATDDYATLGEEFHYYAPITIDCITGKHGSVIQPRVLKTKEEQINRTKDKAEVFTPSWVCNIQNNLIDEAWFGRKDVFNLEHPESKTWSATTEPVIFPEDRTWKDYVRSTRMEITCGEAPYLVSRYDTTTGEFIPIPQRIGMLDRKLRIVSENTSNTGEWLKMVQEAYKNIYAYEWQGDSLLLAREALLITFIEYYEAKFGKRPLDKSIDYIAYIISWNVWQMDGLKGLSLIAASAIRVETYLESLMEMFRLCLERTGLLSSVQVVKKEVSKSTTVFIALLETGGLKILRQKRTTVKSDLSI